MPLRKFQFTVRTMLLCVMAFATLCRFYKVVLLLMCPFLPFGVIVVVGMCLYLLSCAETKPKTADSILEQTTAVPPRALSDRQASTAGVMFRAMGLLSLLAALFALDAFFDAAFLLGPEVASNRPGETFIAPGDEPSDESAIPRSKRRQLAADAVFVDAICKLNNREVLAAEALLKKYITDPYGTHTAEATRLAAEAEISLSFKSAWQTLLDMNDDDFHHFQGTRLFDEQTITHPVLIEERRKTLGRCLQLAALHHETLRREGESGAEVAKKLSTNSH